MTRVPTPSRPVLAALVCFVLVASVLGAAGVAAQTGTTTGTDTGTSAPKTEMGNLMFGDSSVAGTQNGIVYLWASKAARLTGALQPATGAGSYQLCLDARPTTGNGSARRLSCKSLSVSDELSEFGVDVASWPANLTGPQVLDVSLINATSSEVVASSSITVHAIHQDADLDGDGLDNAAEFESGTKVSNPDTDLDGLQDGPEVHVYGSSPTTVDTDGDGIDDSTEVTVYKTDPTKTDTDGDGLNDTVELRTYGTNPTNVDTDGDGVNDGAEINTYETNATNPDTDGEGLDDGVEIQKKTNPNETDTDTDGLNDNLEVHTYGTNPTKADTDGDGIQDGKEVKQYQTDPTEADSDGDGLDDGKEINTYHTNPTDPDTDGDGLNDGPEVHRYGTDPNAIDSDGDGTIDSDEVANARMADQFVLGASVLAVLCVVIGLTFYLFRSGHLAWPPVSVASLPLIAPEGSENGADQDEEEPMRIMSDEERVLALLDEHSGRLKQSAIIDETGWSKSKVSRILSRMADEGQVTKINIGRGNLITIPGAEPEGSRHPFDR